MAGLQRISERGTVVTACPRNSFFFFEFESWMTYGNVYFVSVDPAVLARLEEKSRKISGAMCRKRLDWRLLERRKNGFHEGYLSAVATEELDNYKPVTPKRFIFNSTSKSSSKKIPRQVLFSVQIWSVVFTSFCTTKYTWLTYILGSPKRKNQSRASVSGLTVTPLPIPMPAKSLALSSHCLQRRSWEW